VHYASEADRRHGDGIDRDLDSKGDGSLGPGGDHRRRPTGTGWRYARAFLDQAESGELGYEIRDGRSIEPGARHQVGPGGRPGEVKTLENCGEIVPAQLLGRDPTGMGVRVATVVVWAAQYVAEPL
jgi:hypothetical protein